MEIFWPQDVIVILLHGLREMVGMCICGSYHAIVIEDLEMVHV